MNSFGPLLQTSLPELILIAAACVLFLFGVSAKASTRRLVPWIALAAVIAAAGVEVYQLFNFTGVIRDDWNTTSLTNFSLYIKVLSLLVAIPLVLLAWPGDHEATASSAIDFGTEIGEFFGLMLLSIAGVLLVAGANDIMLLFLGIELASIPTYIMVSISRPLSSAQEAGVKYFFLGAMAAALMLFGFSYLYGTTGTTTITGAPGAARGIAEVFAAQAAAGLGVNTWQLLALVILIIGFAFKIAAVPLHFYAADVYQGAATPVTAFLSFVPKASGFVALLKILYAVGGNSWALPEQIGHLIWWLAVLTMTFGNVLGLLQFNIKRVFAYSSIAHSGYMLVGVATLITASDAFVQQDALRGVLFYLAGYGVMNVAAFGVLILLPTRGRQTATSAETFEDLAGQGRRHVALGLAMAIACFSLIGMPMTIGFFGKFLLLKPAFEGRLNALVIITLINAAISAAYYLKIVASLFLRPEPAFEGGELPPPARQWRQIPVLVAVALSTAATLTFGSIFPASQSLSDWASSAAQINVPAPTLTPAQAAVPASVAPAVQASAAAAVSIDAH